MKIKGLHGFIAGILLTLSIGVFMFYFSVMKVLIALVVLLFLSFVALQIFMNQNSEVTLDEEL